MPTFAIDILNPHDAPLIRDCARTLEQVPEAHITLKQRAASKNEERDATLTITQTGQKATYTIECKQHLAPVLEPTMRQVQAHARRHAARPMIMAPYVNDAMGDRLRAEHIDYVDAVGNAYLHAPPVMVFLNGRKATRTPLKTQRLFHGVAGLQMIALLLTVPEVAAWTIRDVATTAGLSLGSASQLMAELRHGGYLETDRLANTTDLLEQWMHGYHRRLRPRVFQKTYRTTEGRGPQELVPLLAKMPNVLIGGELAASLTTGVLRPARATLHVPPTLDPTRLMRELRLLPDPGGDIDVLVQFGNGDVWTRQGPKGLYLAVPLLVYAELNEIPDDRLRETARAVYDLEIAPHVPSLTVAR